MAPELLDGERVGPATDIYALACLAVETLTGTRSRSCATTTPPPCTPTSSDPPPSVSERRPELPGRARRRASPPAWPRSPTTARPRPARSSPTCSRALGPARARPAWSRRLRGSIDLTRPEQQATAVGGEALNGRYEIVAPISSGAMGAVYRAIDRESGREVAVKRLLDVRHAARFEIEARLLASLSHPRRGQGARPLQRRAGRSTSSWSSSTASTSARCSSATAIPGLTARRRDRVRPPRLRGAAVRARPADRPPRRQAAEHDPRRRRRDPRRLRRRPRARRRARTRARSRSARRATWRPRCSPAAPSRPPATSSASPPRCGRC